jgi:hypothetical protein
MFLIYFLFLFLFSVNAEKLGRSLCCSITSIRWRTLGGVFTYMHVLSRDFDIVFFVFIGFDYIYIWITVLILDNSNVCIG